MSKTDCSEVYCKTMTKLLNLAVSKVHVKCNALYYGQNDGLAMIPP